MTATLDVLIPHYRDPEGLARSLASVAGQSWIAPGRRLRAVVLDDGSPDVERKAAHDVVEAFARRSGQDVLFAANPGNLGRPASRNRLLERVTASHVAWLDCGDIWYPDKLSHQFTHLARLKAQGEDIDRIWVSCAYDWEEADRPLRRLRQDSGGDQAMALLEGERLRAYLWTLLGTARAFALAGRFDERLARLQDLDFFIRFVRAGGRIVAEDGPALCRYFKTNTGRSATQVQASHQLILAKNRPFLLLQPPGTIAALTGRGQYLAARFAAANGRWGKAATHLARAFWHDPRQGARLALALPRVLRRHIGGGQADMGGPGAGHQETGPDEQHEPTDLPPVAGGEAPPSGAFPPAAFRPDRRRITFVIDRLAGRSGGAERVLVETANALARRGHAVEIVTHDLLPGPPFYPLVPGIVLSNLRPPRRGWQTALGRGRSALERRGTGIVAPLDWLLWQSRHGGFHRRLAAHLAATRPDVAVAVLPPALTALSRVAVPPEHGGRTLRRIASLHNVPEEDFDNPARWDPNPRDRRLRKQALVAMDAITVLLPEFRNWFDEALRPRVVVLPNAVAPVDPAALGFAPRRQVVLSVGRLAAVKRHALLLEAWARIAGDFPDWELRIFGDGPDRAALSDRIDQLGIAGSARLMGQCAEIGPEYLSASVLAHPAVFEGFGLAPAEALAAGLPVVAFADCPGVNRLVVDGVNGVLVDGLPQQGGQESSPVPALADALARLMSNAPLRRRLGAAGPASMARFAPDRVAGLWEDLLAGTAQESGRDAADSSGS